MIELKIDELIAALDRVQAAVRGWPPAEATATAKKPRATKATAPEQTQPAATPAAPAATAPAAIVPPAQSPAVSSPPDTKLLVKATDTVIALANEHSRESALAILGKKRAGPGGVELAGVTRCSDLNPAVWQAVLDEAEEAIAQAQAKAATASLV